MYKVRPQGVGRSPPCPPPHPPGRRAPGGGDSPPRTSAPGGGGEVPPQGCPDPPPPGASVSLTLHVLSQFGSASGHGAHPEREFCAPNVQAYAAGCGWVVRLASTHKYSLLRRTATETHHGTDPCSGTRTGGRGAPATYTRDGGATRPNLHATQTGPRRACHASFKRWQRFQPSTRTLIRTGPHTGA